MSVDRHWLVMTEEKAELPGGLAGSVVSGFGGFQFVRFFNGFIGS